MPPDRQTSLGPALLSAEIGKWAPIIQAAKAYAELCHRGVRRCGAAPHRHHHRASRGCAARRPVGVKPGRPSNASGKAQPVCADSDGSARGNVICFRRSRRRAAASPVVLFAAGAGLTVAPSSGFFEEFGQAPGAGKDGATTDFARLAATDDGRLLAGSAEPCPTTGHRAFARCRGLLTKFGDLIRIEHRHRHPGVTRHQMLKDALRVKTMTMNAIEADSIKRWYFQRPILCLKSAFFATPT